MKNLEQLNLLIEKAKSIVGSEYKLAKLIGAPASSITAWKQGKQGCAVGDVVLMAHIAGLDTSEWAARAIVDSYATRPEKQAALAFALKKLWPQIGAGIGTFSVSVASATEEIVDTMYIM